MAQLKSKQLDLSDLINSMAQAILLNPTYKALWSGILNSTFLTAVFSNTYSNITPGQSNFSVTYALDPLEVFVYRNGNKLVNLVDYIKVNNGGSFTVTLTVPVNASVGGVFNETIEINYY